MKASGAGARYTYQQPGVYLVRATLTDAAGKVAAVAYARAVADRASDQPIVRIGFASDGSPGGARKTS